METTGFDRHSLVVRPAVGADFEDWFELFAAVAAEEKWLGSEPPLDREDRRRRFLAAVADGDGSDAVVLAEIAGRQVGQLSLHGHAGLGDLGMLVAADCRGRGVGTALLAAAVDSARRKGCHKLTLQMWPHNVAAQRLYEKFGFVEEGRLRRHYRRRNGELWDAVIMGLVLDTTSPGPLL